MDMSMGAVQCKLLGARFLALKMGRGAGQAFSLLS